MWAILLIIWIVLALLILAFFYGASPRRSYCVEDEIAENQEQIDYLKKWEEK